MAASMQGARGGGRTFVEVGVVDAVEKLKSPPIIEFRRLHRRTAVSRGLAAASRRGRADAVGGPGWLQAATPVAREAEHRGLPVLRDSRRQGAEEGLLGAEGVTDHFTRHLGEAGAGSDIAVSRSALLGCDRRHCPFLSSCAPHVPRLPAPSQDGVLAQVLQEMADKRHPYIVSLQHSFQDDQHLYLVMDFIGGGDLFSLIEKKGRLPEAWARIYSAEIALALNHLHEAGVIYRDLKPENVMVAITGHLKLTDFGFAKKMTGAPLARGSCAPAVPLPELRPFERLVYPSLRVPARPSRPPRLGSPPGKPGATSPPLPEAARPAPREPRSPPRPRGYSSHTTTPAPFPTPACRSKSCVCRSPSPPHAAQTGNVPPPHPFPAPPSAPAPRRRHPRVHGARAASGPGVRRGRRLVDAGLPALRDGHRARPIQRRRPAAPRQGHHLRRPVAAVASHARVRPPPSWSPFPNEHIPPLFPSSFSSPHRHHHTYTHSRHIHPARLPCFTPDAPPPSAG
eukprot:scaffold2325_cov105-Isochrysis_galbana.AAC.7